MIVAGLYLMDVQFRKTKKTYEMVGADLALAAVTFNITLLVTTIYNLPSVSGVGYLPSTRSDMLVSIIFTVLDLLVWGICLSLVGPKRQINLIVWSKTCSGQFAYRLSSIMGLSALISMFWILGPKLTLMY